ncbi:hypothetical protein PHYSODRAFT_491041 [Phytophthora sojae]|uniref:Uncharacterized protein n=1 Tax=Phytophthora sojae (strain P6497) TaxID=1094619 RepID=G4Z584_PHYSP|nr:hypothetical protein PHYSODRAFT_491041 [Phytophthora sojae]EGZ20227.1 hypothetical protein PHYSODRAFT_491041 [Phytophthora sojae]|eukprot:XP_009522944.1 hypothetical protein PHYSODRAFT_491041 [Phytophthora sojae]
MGRRLKSPNDLLRRASVEEAGKLTSYHRRLLAAMTSSRECAEVARTREQERQARYYDRRVTQKREFVAGDRAWLYKPPRGPKATKLVLRWLGPVRVIEPAGYDNYLVKRENVSGVPEQSLAHVSFLISYHHPATFLKMAAADIEEQLEYGDALQLEANEAAAATVVRAEVAPVRAAAREWAAQRREGGRGVAEAGEHVDVMRCGEVEANLRLTFTRIWICLGINCRGDADWLK